MKVKLLKQVDDIPSGTIVEVKKATTHYYTIPVPPTLWEIIKPDEYKDKNIILTYWKTFYNVDQSDFEILD